MATVQEANDQLRDIWRGHPFIPPEWKLAPKETALMMVLYRKRGVAIGRHNLMLAIYGHEVTAHENVISVMCCHIRKRLKKAGTPVTIQSNNSMEAAYWLDVTSIHEMDYLLDLSIKPIPYRRYL